MDEQLTERVQFLVSKTTKNLIDRITQETELPFSKVCRILIQYSIVSYWTDVLADGGSDLINDVLTRSEAVLETKEGGQ